MLVKVSELTGRALNYAVAVCEYGEPKYAPACGWHMFGGGYGKIVRDAVSATPMGEEFNPSGNWSHGGPLIDKYATQLSAPSSFDNEGHIAATYVKGKGQGLKSGNTYLVAFCRALVSAIHRDDEIEIPDELVEA